MWRSGVHQISGKSGHAPAARNGLALPHPERSEPTRHRALAAGVGPWSAGCSLGARPVLRRWLGCSDRSFGEGSFTPPVSLAVSAKFAHRFFGVGFSLPYNGHTEIQQKLNAATKRSWNHGNRIEIGGSIGENPDCATDASFAFRPACFLFFHERKILIDAKKSTAKVTAHHTSRLKTKTIQLFSVRGFSP